MCNAYKILNIIEARSYAELRKHEAHKVFRMKLVKALYARSERLKPPSEDVDHFSKELAHSVNHAAVIEHGRIARLTGKDSKYCVPCSVAGRKARKSAVRMSLQELFCNSTVGVGRRARPSTSIYGCQLCAMPICPKTRCWREHIEAI